MVLAWAVVIVAIVGVVSDRQWWFLGVALLVELGVVFVGARWLLPVLADGEVADASDTTGPEATFAELAARIVGTDELHLAGRAPNHMPHIAAGVSVGDVERAQGHLEGAVLGGVVRE